MQIQVRYFASLREALGCAGESVTVEPGCLVGGLRDLLLQRGGAYQERLARTQAVRVAVNHVLLDDETTPLEAGSEVAFFPPVTGG
jgi:sulfur-carrier protein